jgi:hypothetical protein
MEEVPHGDGGAHATRLGVLADGDVRALQHALDGWPRLA